MRKAFAVLAVAVVSLAVPKAFAYDCTNRYQVIIGPGTWWEYVGNPLDTSASDCWSLGSTSPVWNSSASMWEYTTWNDQYATRVINVPSTDSGTSSWSASITVDFYDPNASWWEGLDVDIAVNHLGGVTHYSLYSNVGNATAFDSGRKDVNFTAVSGDTITINIRGRNSFTNSHVRFAGVHVWRQG
jgi:hypothetical protein